jgi:hypothetical protein
MASAYTAMVASIRTGMVREMRSFAPVHRWRGTAHRVLLRNPYADIGLTCLDGQAAVWIGERIDRDYRIRCEWSDVSGRPVTGSPASRRLSRPAPSALALSPSTHPSISLGSKPPDRVPSGDPYVPTAYLWRMARRQPWPHHC